MKYRYNDIIYYNVKYKSGSLTQITAINLCRCYEFTNTTYNNNDGLWCYYLLHTCVLTFVSCAFKKIHGLNLIRLLLNNK